MIKLNTTMTRTVRALSWALCISLAACAPKVTDVYHDANIGWQYLPAVESGHRFTFLPPGR